MASESESTGRDVPISNPMDGDYEYEYDNPRQFYGPMSGRDGGRGFGRDGGRGFGRGGRGSGRGGRGGGGMFGDHRSPPMDYGVDNGYGEFDAEFDPRSNGTHDSRPNPRMGGSRGGYESRFGMHDSRPDPRMGGSRGGYDSRFGMHDSRPDPRMGGGSDPRFGMHNSGRADPRMGGFDSRFGMLHNFSDFNRFDDHHYPRFCPWMWRSESDKSNYKREFKVAVNVSQFQPEDLNVTVVDGHVKIHGKHEEREDQQGYIIREFIRRYQLPDDVDPATVKSKFGLGGLLSVFAPMKLAEGDGEVHEVPIEIDPKSPAPEAEDNEK